MNIPQEAVEAAEDALRADIWDGDPEDIPPTMGREAELAVAAAEPHLRRKWAEEIREGVNPPDTGKEHEWRLGFITGVLRTARFLEGAEE